MPTVALQTVDEAGIRLLDGRSNPPDHLLVTKENADFIRHKVVDMTAKLNAAHSKFAQPFTFTHRLLDSKDDWELCTHPGRKLYLTLRLRGENPPLMTQLMAEVGALGLSTFRSQVRGTPITAMNWMKPEQGGKSNDSYRNNILICSANWIESGRQQETRPLVILPSEQDLERQMRQEWQRMVGFMGLLEINHNGLSVSLQSFFEKWYDLNDPDNTSFWLRRTSGDTAKQRFLLKLKAALDQNALLLISVDEADKGIGDRSVIVSWFKEIIPGYNFCLYDCFRKNDHPQNFKLVNYSATLEAFLQIKGNTVNVTVPTEINYNNWRDIPRYTMGDYAKKFGVPDLSMLGDTCSSQHSPYGDAPGCLKKFIRMNYVMNGNVVRKRKSNEDYYAFDSDELEELMAHPGILDDWAIFKEKTVPKTFAKFLRKRFSLPDRKRGLCIRYTLQNALNMRLVGAIRDLVSEKEVILIPIASTHDDVFEHLDGVFKAVNWKKDMDINEAIRDAYHRRGIPYLSVPYCLFVSGTARRGTKLLNDTVHVEFTHEPTTETSMSQACGRAGGYKDNTELVVTDSHMRIINGEKSIPYSEYTKGKRGRKRSMITLLRRNSDHILSEEFDWIDENIINKASQLKILRAAYRRGQKGKLRGGEHLIFPDKTTEVGNIADIITPDVMTKIEQNHETLFQDELHRPEFVQISLLRMNPDSMDQPKSNILTKAWHNPKDKTKSETKRREEYMVRDLGHCLYFPVGFRNASDDLNITLNTQDRRKPYLQNIQVLYDYNERTNRMKCVGLTFRLADYPVVARMGVPKENTHPFNFALDEQQEEWRS